MNNKGQKFVEKSFAFILLWIVSALIWSFYLDGIGTAIGGFLTAIIVLFIIDYYF